VRVALIHNPGAGDEQHSAKAILKELAEAGYDAYLQPTRKEGVEEALADPGDPAAASRWRSFRSAPRTSSTAPIYRANTCWSR
jgi:hypothetical protein